MQHKIDIEKLSTDLESVNTENTALNERLKNQTSEMLALHESDVKGKIANEELRTTKDQLQKLKNDMQRMKISRSLLNSLNSSRR